jgi:hypothetical protein
MGGEASRNAGHSTQQLTPASHRRVQSAAVSIPKDGIAPASEPEHHQARSAKEVSKHSSLHHESSRPRWLAVSG